MNIRVLDCTLRDGGYCNNWNFREKNIKKIIDNLMKANVNIIECGFLTNKVEYNPDKSKFTKIEQISSFLPSNRGNALFVAMVNYGEYNIDDLPDYDGKSIDGIRVAFHKKNMREAMEYCDKIQKKGYKVFIQAMLSLSYSDSEFLELISLVNRINPYAFYIVDSFGNMKGNDLTRYFYLVDNNLSKNINVGFHSHNNLQLAFSNAQLLTSIAKKRNLIVDSSIFGMGRGAGNLNTELFAQYLNENNGANYDIKPLLSTIDDTLNMFYQENSWGYSLPNYLSAIHNAHPNYANYLAEKNTLGVDDINEIFELMDESKKASFDKEYISNLYFKYMEKNSSSSKNLNILSQKLFGKKVLLIAPGKSSIYEKSDIIRFVSENDVVTISVNFDYPIIDTDFIFLSNLKRYAELPSSKYSKCITTSNIPENNVFVKYPYQELVNSHDLIVDNAGLMAIKLLIKLGVKSVYLAGFDGYSQNSQNNYGEIDMTLVTKRNIADELNRNICEALREFSRDAIIYFITKSKYSSLECSNIDTQDRVRR